MTKKAKFVLALTLIICVALCGCGSEFKSYRPITDVNNLDGRKIGVNLGLAADYILSPRDGDDLYLCRYDSAADILLALYYRQIDAICCDSLSWGVMESTTQGFKRCEEYVAMDGFLAYVNPEKEYIRDKLNEFLKYYKTTSAYEAIMKSVNDLSTYGAEFGRNSDKNGTGEKVTVAYSADCYPSSYPDTDGTALGYDVELLYDFAAYSNYEIEFVPTSYQDMCMGTLMGRYDIGIGCISLSYKEDAEVIGILPSDVLYDVPLYLVEIADPDNLEIGNLF